MQDTLDWLASEVAARSPGTELAITVEDLQTGARAQLAGDALHVSASSAKAWWTAAALYGTSVAAVMPHARPIFASSDNAATGSAIDLVGPNYVNTFMWDVAEMPNSALTSWSYGRTRVASNSPRALGSDNYATTEDAVRFLARLHRGELFDNEKTVALLDWLTLAPRTGVGGWLAARLPADAHVAHKAGWLPPGCCSDDRRYNTLNDVGIVTAPDGRAYAVAIFARRGLDYWNKQTTLVELASCSIYRAFTQDDSLDCARGGDPRPAATCGDVGYHGYCDGTRVVWCEDGALKQKDCAADARTCAWQDDNVGYNCVAADVGCGDVTYAGYCDGTTLVWCENATLRTKQCTTCGFQNADVGYNCL